MTLFALSNCSRFAIVTNDLERKSPFVVRLPESSSVVAQKLEAYLRGRDHLEKSFRSQMRFDFIQPWIRDSSLRYHLLDFDERKRHLCQWKAQWTLEGNGTHDTELSVKVLEVIFMGSPRDANSFPTLEQAQGNGLISDWFETDPDNLRAALEIRRFWIENYPLLPLPKEIATLTLPSLDGMPVSRTALRRRWEPLQRTRSF